jgi:hypothetical protein
MQTVIFDATVVDASNLQRICHNSHRSKAVLEGARLSGAIHMGRIRLEKWK